MKVRKSQLIEIDQPNFKYLTTTKFSKFSGINAGFLYRVKHGQVVISESLYNKINTSLTNFVASIQ